MCTKAARTLKVPMVISKMVEQMNGEEVDKSEVEYNSGGAYLRRLAA